MRTRHKNKALIGIPLGLLLLGPALVLSISHMIPFSLGMTLFLAGIILYTWGCLALAIAKGYSTAIVLTVVLGILFPAVVLLALPDKNKRRRY